MIICKSYNQPNKEKKNIIHSQQQRSVCSNVEPLKSSESRLLTLAAFDEEMIASSAVLLLIHARSHLKASDCCSIPPSLICCCQL